MITLSIKYADGSPYWTEYFNSLDECNKWLIEEQTRPYWNNSKDGKGKEVWTYSIVDNSPPEKTPAEIAAERAATLAKITALQQSKTDISNLDLGKVASLAEIKDVIVKIRDILLKIT